MRLISPGQMGPAGASQIDEYDAYHKGGFDAFTESDEKS